MGIRHLLLFFVALSGLVLAPFSGAVASEACVVVSTANSFTVQVDSFSRDGASTFVSVSLHSLDSGATAEYWDGSDWQILPLNLEVQAAKVRVSAQSSGTYKIYYSYVDPCSEGDYERQMVVAVV
ncbi:MAG: hypothetical protein KDD42_01315 [Bdellovibrionales bacterium]|nr:hypothetical protein [Bdellovibrionales bacterium]